MAQACQSAACWPSGAERDTSWSAVKKSTAVSGMANHSGATTCLSVKVSRFIEKIKQIFSFTLQLTYSCSQEFTATAIVSCIRYELLHCSGWTSSHFSHLVMHETLLQLARKASLVSLQSTFSCSGNMSNLYSQNSHVSCETNLFLPEERK